jgi:lysophospholipase L1-like esterase
LPVIDDNETPRGDGDWSDGFPTADHWLALGDSYSAGVGAGNVFLDNPQDPDHHCLTTTGSYPKRLERGYPALNKGLEFFSCSGDVISNINNAGSNGRATQLELMKAVPKGSYKFATLSIGGNDLGFFNIVISCIMIGSGDCEAALKNAESIAGISPRDSAAHGDTLANLYKVYRDILDTAGDDFTLIVTGYAQFFASTQGNTACDNGQIQVISLQDLGSDGKPALPLTVRLRERINDGVKAFNQMINATVSEVQRSLENDKISNKRIKFVDIDPIFEGHRFCEPGSSTDAGFPEFTDKAWFFSSAFRSDILPGGQKVVPRADDNSPGLELDRRGSNDCNDPYYAWDCALGKLRDRYATKEVNGKEYPRGSTLNAMLLEISKNMVFKAFHPKSIAYDAISKKIAATLGDNSVGPVSEEPGDPQNPGDTAEFYIWPEDGRDNKQVEQIASNLERYIIGGSKLEPSTTETFGLNYWRITDVTVAQAMEISNLTNVSYVPSSVLHFR